ncbi:MAG: hypothetical protein H6574_07555 [Lewinellaceae bacterium]|nr:hypothetical protein [Lewinellaceae bacterium]
MKGKKFIITLLLIFSGIWFFQYFLCYIEGAHTIGVMLIGLFLWFVLFCILLYQFIILTIENPKHYQRLNYIGLIFLINLISLAKPKGLIDWEKFEGENLMVAEMEGTANCRVIIKLRENNIFKYSKSCFGIDFHFGTYKLSNDSIYFELKNNVGYMDTLSYATLLKSGTDSTKLLQMNLYRNFEDKRSVTFRIKEIKMNKLSKLK